MEPGLDEARENAPYCFRMRVEAVQLVEPSTTGGTHRCEVTGTVLEVRQRPLSLFRQAKAAPAQGARITISLRCWPCESNDEPTGPRRIYYEVEQQPAQLVVWGEVRDDRFVVADFEESF